MKIKFTDSFIRSLKATGKPYSHGDTEHKGLMIRVSATGTRTFALAYHSKADQKTRFLTFGQYGDVGLADAFAAHAKARAALASGEDPQAEKAEERALTKSTLSYEALVLLFVAGKLGRQRTAHDRTLRLHRAGRRFGWTQREIASITEDEAEQAIIKLAEKGYTNERGKPVGGRVEAFATKSLLGEMWRWAKRRKLIARNIFADLEVEEARKPRRRSRVLSYDEIRAVWTELDHPEEFGFSADSATALRLILATTARPGIVCGMSHDELVDLDAPQPKPVTHGMLRDVTDGNGPLWILPHERMKRDDEDDNTEPFIVPLNAMSVHLIRQTNSTSGRVLRACKPGGKELVSPNKIAALMRAVVAKLGIPRATPHDLRRTASTLIQSAVLPDRPKYLLEEVGWLLSHRSQDKNGVTGIYGHYEHLDEKRAMATVLARELSRILGTATAVRAAA
jgi:integrase